MKHTREALGENELKKRWLEKGAVILSLKHEWTKDKGGPYLQQNRNKRKH